jgi:hypothetical protein
MDQRLGIITLGANNLQTLRHFYTDIFGWKPVAENKDIVFFKLNGFLFSIFGRKELAKTSNVSAEGHGFRSFVLAYLVDSKQEVEELYHQLKSRHVKIIQEPQTPPFGGYYFLLADAEDNLWEVACNPYIPLDEAGNVITHKSIDHLQYFKPQHHDSIRIHHPLCSGCREVHRVL